MDVKKIDDDISVAAQLTLSDVVEAAKLGFRTIISNRPDGEEFGQLSTTDLEAVTKANGMEWVFFPVESGNITDTNADDFIKIYEQAEKPMLAFCRSGARCVVLWALSSAHKASADTLISQARNAGFNIASQKAHIMQRARHSE